MSGAPGSKVLHAATLRWLDELAIQGIFTTDEALNVCSWNKWLEGHTGKLSAAVVGRPLLSEFPELVERGLDVHYQAALGGEVRVLAHSFHRHLLRGRAGTSEPAQTVRIAPLEENGAVVGTITVIDDVGERVASERELRNQVERAEFARAMAEDVVRAKDEFLATLSHEIRTPLNAVLGWTKILLSRDVDAVLLKRALTVIDRNATAQMHMVDDMLDMARIMSGKLRIETRSLDMRDVVLAAVDVMMPAATAKGLRLETSIDKDMHMVAGDPDRLQQVIWNLLSNAVKFTEPGGEIRVGLGRQGRMVRVWISDTGPGIAPEFMPVMFERFSQAHASASRRHGGLGLGLPLVRQLVELHGGTVNATSIMGTGSLFTVLLPQINEGASPGNGFPVDRGVQALVGVRVLVVEGEADARELTMTSLQHYGVIVSQASSSREALRSIDASFAEGQPVRAVVSDVRLPGEDEYSLMEHIRQRPAARGGDLPVIALSPFGAPRDRERALAAGFHTHLVKPVDPSALAAVLRTALGRTPGMR